MRVLVCFEGRVRPDSTGFYLLNAFKSLGHTVEHVYPDRIMDVKPGNHDLYVRCDDGLKQYGWNPALRPSHYYCIDTHIETDWRIALAKNGAFDTVSVVHSEGLNLDWGKEAYWLPVGCDESVHYVGPREKRYDGCFIGNFHNGLSGPRVEMLDTFFKSTPEIFFGARMYREMAEKYAESKLVFNRSINGDVNMRVFEALCSGSCLVTDRVPDLDKLGFLDGVHYVGYSGKEELERVVKALLADDAKRESIAAAGRSEVMKHTYSERMKVLMSKLEQTKGEKKWLLSAQT